MMSGALQSSPVKNDSAYNPQNHAASDVASEAHITDDGTEDDEEVLKPRGRLAARMLDSNDVECGLTQEDIDESHMEIMQAISDSEFEHDMDIENARIRRRNRLLGITSSDEDEISQPESESGDEIAEGLGIMSARERLRRMLMVGQNPAQDEQAEHKSNASSDDEEDAPVPSRKRHRITQKSSPKSSPVTSPQFSRESLFVSPGSKKARSPAPGDSDSEDLPAAPMANPRFMALVAKKRQERLANEAALAEKKKKAEERARTAAQHSSLLENDDISGSDDDGGRRLTQQIRPTRKASKKALEEMHRETQRMSRNMQLAHQAKTKKKITKSSLFAKFNYKPEGFVEEETTASSSPPRTDVEMHDTPPTSPMSPSLAAEKSISVEAGPAEISLPQNLESENEAEMPSIQDVLSSQHVPSSPSRPKVDKGKGKAVQQSPSPKKAPSPARQMTVRVRAPMVLTKAADAGDDSDDDLEIITSKTPVKSKVKSKRDLDSIFDRVPARKARESTGLHALRLLAHLSSPTRQTNKKNAKPSITNSELQLSLQQRARQQAAREREDRLQALRDRGIIVQTAEEREKELGEVEDMMAKARREGEEIAKGEKAAAKKEKKENGEMDPLDMDSSDDEEWQEEVEKFSQQMSPSGSEDEGGDERDDEEDVSGEDDENEEMEDAGPLNKNEVATPNPLVCDEASESESPEDEDVADDEASGFINDAEEEETPNVTSRRRTKNTNVISDDEDDDISALQSPQPLPMHTPGSRKTTTTSPLAPMSVLRSATKTFIPGVTVSGPAGLSLTQIFAGTMDDSQQDFDATPMDSPSQRFDSQQDSLAFLRNLPPPEFPDFAPTVEEDSQDVVESSQIQIDHIPATQPTQAETQGIQLSFSQSQIHGFDSLVDPSQYSEFPEATQDEGFSFMSPIVGRFTQPRESTVDTVMLESTPAPDPTPETIEESPIVKRTGKLRRRIQAPVLSDDEEAEPTDDFEITPNVFDTMRKASKKSKSKAAVVSDFDKKKSGAKEMVQEQASESEDEYAGLGGASDDESDGEDEADQAMIDDENRGDFDERKLAAFYADRERAADEQQVNKLFKDITSGMLRKKRGADYDLSDSDDDGEARRRMKRREFAKMRKALLEDERIGKIAENPKRAAFLRAIEDRGEDEEMSFLDDEIVNAEHATSSQPVADDEESQEVTSVPNSQPDTTAAMGPPKRKATTEPEARLPPHLRRTKALASKRPSSLSEIRASLSSLIDDPNAAHVAAAEDSDSDLEIEGAASSAPAEHGKGKGKENHDPFAPRRAGKSAVVDRISLKRNSSSSSSLSASTRLAFAVSSSAAGFKVPPLLRRATTNSSTASTGGSADGAAERRMGDSKAAPKKAGKGVAFYTREEERTAVMKEGEKKRQEKLFKGVEGRRKVVGGLFARGSFA